MSLYAVLGEDDLREIALRKGVRPDGDKVALAQALADADKAKYAKLSDKELVAVAKSNSVPGKAATVEQLLALILKWEAKQARKLIESRKVHVYGGGCFLLISMELKIMEFELQFAFKCYLFFNLLFFFNFFFFKNFFFFF